MKRLAILIGLMSFPSWAMPVSEQLAAASVPRAQAIVLAKLLNNEATVIGNTDDDRLAADLMEQLGGSNTRLAALEKDRPGVLRAIAFAMLPVINKSARERLPILWQRQALLYSEVFSDADLQTLIKFYGSSTGKKLIAGATSAKPNATIAEMKRSPDFKPSADAVLRDLRAATPSVMVTLDAADRVALTSLYDTGLLSRMRALAPRTQALVIEWSNESAPWEDEALENATAAAIERYSTGAK